MICLFMFIFWMKYFISIRFKERVKWNQIASILFYSNWLVSRRPLYWRKSFEDHKAMGPQRPHRTIGVWLKTLMHIKKKLKNKMEEWKWDREILNLSFEEFFYTYQFFLLLLKISIFYLWIFIYKFWWCYFFFF